MNSSNGHDENDNSDRNRMPMDSNRENDDSILQWRRNANYGMYNGILVMIVKMIEILVVVLMMVVLDGQMRMRNCKHYPHPTKRM